MSIKRLKNKICVVCKKQFTPRKSKQKCCSVLCSVKKRSEIQKKGAYNLCKNCGRSFWVTPSRVSRGWGVYCSISCQHNLVGKELRKKNEENFLRDGCSVCGGKETKNMVHGYCSQCYSRKRSYKLSDEQLKKIISVKFCSIRCCAAPLTKDSMCIDHCHVDGFVRGPVCGKCNRYLGVFEKVGNGYLDYNFYIFSRRKDPNAPFLE